MKHKNKLHLSEPQLKPKSGLSFSTQVQQQIQTELVSELNLPKLQPYHLLCYTP